MLMQMGEQLVEAGYKKMHADELKGRHLHALLQRWRAEGLSPGTLRNRLSALRWWAEKIGNSGVLAHDNAHYGIPKRQSAPRTTKAKDLPDAQLAQVRNSYVRMSLALQHAFGLRREESIKLKPHQADRGDRLVLQASWTKGGRPREIPIRTLAQREVLDKAKACVKGKAGSLIPGHKSYVQQLRTYEHCTRMAGLDHLHGLRHAYAQERFLELAGFACPVTGGPHAPELTPEQRASDYEARLIISAELGHSREAITVAYLGR